jgi:single-strand DNA-binding protein
MGVNKVILIGFLGKDPETKVTNGGMSICEFSLATSEKYKGETKTEWHNIVCFAKTADVCAQYLSKGSQVYIEGRIQTDSWEKDGERKYRTKIIMSNFSFLDRKSGGGNGGNNSAPAQSQPRANNAYPEDDDTDIPF